MDKSRYPSDWDEISRRIRFDRAGGKCEWCGAPNGKEIVRSSADPARYIVLDEETYGYTWPDGQPIRMSEIPDEYDILRGVRVILTVHHKGIPHEDGAPGDRHDKMDVREENLAALCQRCHLYADLDIHISNAKITRARKKREQAAKVGQLDLFAGGSE